MRDYIVIRLMDRLHYSFGLLNYPVKVAATAEQSVIVEWLKLVFKLDVFHLWRTIMVHLANSVATQQ